MPEAVRGKPGNIAAHLAQMAQLQPQQPAVICARGRESQGDVAYEHLSFSELEEESNLLARGLEGIGIRRGVRTALMVPPSVDFFTLTFALFKVGAVPVLIDPGIGLANLRDCLAHAQPAAFIGISKAHAARVLLGWARASVRINVTAGARWFWGGHTLSGLRRQTAAASQTFVAIEPEADETAAILFTSGSTGAPKGAVYTHEMFGAQVEHIRQLYGIEPGETDLATFPLFALFGPALGMSTVVPEMDASRPAKVDPENIVSAIRKFGVTNMFGSPVLIDRVGRHGEKHKLKLPTLRRAISAGAPVPAKVLERFAAMLSPGAQIFTPYGATECLPVASIGSGEILDETRHRTDAGEGVCVGPVVPGVVAKIIRISDAPVETWSDDLQLPAGEIGEIAVKAAHASRSYFNLPAATALAKIEDAANGGFYHRMGDVGYFDRRGRLWFCGRKAHRVVTRDKTLFSIPCEGVFNAHPKVYRCALVGVEKNGTTEPVLCVELEAAARGDSPETLREELRRLGAGHAHTRDIKTFLFHPAFPVDVRHNAKIFREKLAVWAAGRLR
ncbi:MAG: peptide synthase [Betaproteobacteria bacterium RIFCSPLOWO2_02_FULL_62_17]|nr:MAG: peptide synthase [Betaproteobacteria bacterium RIFCSPLOWO2_02_FULL_62_17]